MRVLRLRCLERAQPLMQPTTLHAKRRCLDTARQGQQGVPEDRGAAHTPGLGPAAAEEGRRGSYQARARGCAPIHERQAALLAHDAGARLRLVGGKPGGALRVRAVRRVHRARHRRAEADARARQRRSLRARAGRRRRLLLP